MCTDRAGGNDDISIYVETTGDFTDLQSFSVSFLTDDLKE